MSDRSFPDIATQPAAPAGGDSGEAAEDRLRSIILEYINTDIYDWTPRGLARAIIAANATPSPMAQSSESGDGAARTREPDAWQARWPGEDWEPVIEPTPDRLMRIRNSGRETRPLYLDAAQASGMRDALKKISEFSSGDDTTLGALKRLAAVRDIAIAAIEASSVPSAPAQGTNGSPLSQQEVAIVIEWAKEHDLPVPAALFAHFTMSRRASSVSSTDGDSK